MNKYLVEYSGHGSDYLVSSKSIEIESQHCIVENYAAVRKEVINYLSRLGYLDIKIISIKKRMA